MTETHRGWSPWLCWGLSLGLTLGVVARAGPPAPVQEEAPPPAYPAAPAVAPGEAASATMLPASDAADEEFIEFLGADDDAVRLESLKNSAQRRDPTPPPPQDATS